MAGQKPTNPDEATTTGTQPSATPTPPAAEDTTTANDPLAQKKAALAAIDDELGGMPEKLKMEFYKKLPELMTPEEHDMRFEDDASNYLSMIDAKKQQFIDDVISAKKGQRDALHAELADDEDTANAQSAKVAFKEQYPEADEKAMSDTYMNDLTPREASKLHDSAGGDYKKFLEELHAIHSARTGGKDANAGVVVSIDAGIPPPEADPKLPPEFSGSGSNGNADFKGSANEEYLKKIGLRK